MLPPLTSSPPQLGGKPDQLGNPPHGLPFDLGRERRQPPRPDVLIESGRQEIAEHPDRRGARGDVAEKARMPVEQRVVEQQSGRLAHQPAGVGAGRRKRLLGPERPPDVRRRFVGRHQPVRQLRQSIGDLIDEAMSDLPELAGRHFKRRLPLSERFELRRNVHRNPSNKSDSCARPPLTLLKTR